MQTSSTTAFHSDFLHKNERYLCFFTITHFYDTSYHLYLAKAKKTIKFTPINKTSVIKFKPTRKIAAVSIISSIKVLCPFSSLSAAPTLAQRDLSFGTLALEAGTKEPACANRATMPHDRIHVDLPPILAPVTMCIRHESAIKETKIK